MLYVLVQVLVLKARAVAGSGACSEGAGGS